MHTKSTSTCLQKAGEDEPIFVLRAHDLTADVIVKAWAMGQLYVHRLIANGWTHRDAVGLLESRLAQALLPPSIEEVCDGVAISQHTKVAHAFHCSDLMFVWPDRKLPD